MTDSVIKVPSLTLASLEPQSPPKPPVEPQASGGIVVDQPRLAIEQGPSGFVYKVLDRVTGDVIRQVPHQSLADLAQDPGYDAGGVIKTSV